MDKPKAMEQLFLLEILIDKVILTDEPERDPETPESPVKVRVKFIEFPVFEINQQDFKKEDEDIEIDGNFNSGKSCLFPMIPVELIRNLQRYPLAVTVYRIDPDAPVMPIIVGQTRVRLTEGMCEAIQTAMNCNCNAELPISHTIKDTYQLTNIGGDVGTITLFVRLSCFGQSIVTQFQLMGEKKAFLFKNSKSDNANQCKRNSQPREPTEPRNYDILPVNPFISGEDNIYDPCPCGDSSTKLDDASITWRMNESTAKDNRCPGLAELKKDYPKSNQCPGQAEMKESYTKGNRCSLEGDECRRCSQEPPRDFNACTCDEYDEQFPPEPELEPDMNPVLVRYDTTGALSPAYLGGKVAPPPEPIVPVQYCQCGAESPQPSPRNSYGDGDGDDCRLPDKNQSPRRLPFVSTCPVYGVESSPEVVTTQLSRHTSYSDKDVREMKVEREIPIKTRKPKEDGKKVGLGVPQKQPEKKKKIKKKRTRWSYKWGLQYPGIKFGHRDCVLANCQVPANMGWLWKSSKSCKTNIKQRKGWKPGAVSEEISKIINDHRVAAGKAPINKPPKSKFRRGRRTNAQGVDEGDDGPQPPTLHIHRKDGNYFISMCPLNLPGSDAEQIPLQFKIPKQHHEHEEGDEPSSSDESELEIEFMAPGAYEPKKEPPVFKSMGTQYREKDIQSADDKGDSLQLDKKGKKGKDKDKKGGSAKGGKKGKK